LGASAHTRLQGKARDWENNQRNDSFLLRGLDLQDALQWIAKGAVVKKPKPLPLHEEYIRASQEWEAREINRLTKLQEQEAQQAKRFEELAKQEEQLNGIQKILEAQAGNLPPEKLFAKYPLGYVIFDLDYENRVIPYDSRRILDKYDLDWNVVRFTKNTPTQIEIRLPDAKIKNGGAALTNAVTGGIKRVGNLGGYMIGDLMVWGEILAIRQNGIIFLVGFDRAPKLPGMK
jgi:hypothetical protein